MTIYEIAYLSSDDKARKKLLKPKNTKKVGSGK